MKDEIETIEFGFKEKILQYYFLHRGKVHSWTAGIIGGCVLGIAYLAVGPNDADYLKAQSAFQEWSRSPADSESEQKMRTSIQKIPGLQRCLEAEIAQIYLAHGMTEPAELMVRRSLNRLMEISPFHAQFGESTLYIEKGDYQKALELSVNLKEKMDASIGPSVSHSGGGEAKGVLYLSNLLRIAVLHKQLNNGPGELASWEELKGLLETSGNGSAAAKALQSSFGSKAFSLRDFISLRERLVH